MQISKIKTKISSLVGMEMWEVLTSITVILSIASVLLWVGTLQPSSVQAFTGNINQLKVDSFNLYIESSLIGIDNFIECTDNPQEDYQKLGQNKKDINILSQYLSGIDEDIINYENELGDWQVEYQNKLNDFVNTVREYIFFKKNILDAQYSKNVTILDSCLVINDKWDIEKTQNDLKPYSDNVLQKLAELEKTEIDIMGKNYRDGVFLGVR